MSRTVRPASPAALAKAAAKAEISRLRHISLYESTSSGSADSAHRYWRYEQLLDSAGSDSESGLTKSTLTRQSPVSWSMKSSLTRPPRSIVVADDASVWQTSSCRDDDLLRPVNSVAYPDLKVSALHETLFVVVVVLAQFMALAALGQGISAQDKIANAMHVHAPPEVAWFTAAYSLTVGTFILIAGRLGDMLGHKRLFVFGYFWLGTWSCFAGFSAYVERPIFFDACRAMQGTGAAILAPNALALLGRAYPAGNKKNMVFALFGAMAPWGFVVGACTAGLLSELTWWPWTFWSYGIAAWALCAMALLAIPKTLAYEAQFVGRLSTPGMDWNGCFLGVSGLVLLNIGLNNGPAFGWNRPSVYCPLVFGFLSLLCFLWVEARAVSPLLPVKMIDRTIVWTLTLLALGWGSFGIWLWYGWRFLVEARGQRSLEVSTEYTPALICGALAAGASGFMLTHTPVSFTMATAMLFFLVGQLVAATQPVHQVYWKQMFVSIILMPFGMDMSFPAGSIILSNHMPLEHQGLAASLVNTVVNYSIALALGIAGTVEAQVLKHSSTEAANILSIRYAQYTGVLMAGIGVILGGLLFVRTIMSEGWKVQ